MEAQLKQVRSIVYLKLPSESTHRKLGEIKDGVFSTYRTRSTNTLSKFSREGEIGFNAQLIDDRANFHFATVVVNYGGERLEISRQDIQKQRTTTFKHFERQYMVPLEAFQKG